MVSPGFLSHLVMVPSVMDSPIWGMTTSVGMNFSSPSKTDTDGRTSLFLLDRHEACPFGLYGGRAIVGLDGAVSERLHSRRLVTREHTTVGRWIRTRASGARRCVQSCAPPH